jgi:hypothetical protein
MCSQTQLVCDYIENEGFDVVDRISLEIPENLSVYLASFLGRPSSTWQASTLSQTVRPSPFLLLGKQYPAALPVSIFLRNS